MPWTKTPNSDKTPSEEIFGMKSEEVLAQLKAGADAKAKLDELQTTFGTQFNEIKEALSKLQVTPGSNNASGNNNGNQDGGNGGNNNGGNTNNETLPDFITDPEGAFTARANKTFAPLVNMTLETRADIVFDRVKNGIPDFNLFEDEIRKELQTAPLQYRTNEGYIRNAYHMVKGRHADEIAADRAKGSGKYFVEGATSITNNLNNNTKDKTVLTQEEKDYAAKFGLTEQEYIDSKKGLKYV